MKTKKVVGKIFAAINYSKKLKLFLQGDLCKEQKL